MRGALAIGSLVTGLLSFSACSDEQLIDGLFTEAEWTKVQSFSPLPAPPPSPTNRFADDAKAARLGQRLWFEKRYAGPITEGSVAEGGVGEIGEQQKVSCAVCHDPKSWYQDARPDNKNSLGTARTRRNAPSMVNAAYYDWGNWAGSHDQLWKQGANSPESRDNFNSDRLRYAHVIYEYYRDDYAEIFGPLDPALAPDDTSGRFPPSGKPKAKPDDPNGPWEMMDPADQEIVNQIMANCGKALEAYERRLVSGNAPFDQYVAGDHTALSASAKRGLKLFIGKAACDMCHSGTTFTDQKFHHTGVMQPGRDESNFDLGLWDDVTRLDNPFNGAGIYSDDRAAGQAKLDTIELTRNESMKGQFRTKSLRHVGKTAPYFHNGCMPTLTDVVRFYNDGGSPVGTYPGVKDPQIVPLNLTDGEIADIVAFLEALTGDLIPDELMQDTSAIMPVQLRGTYIATE